MTDRLDRANTLRSALHRWLQEHPGAAIAAIVAAFPDSLEATVRKSVHRLVAAGCARADRTGKTAHYHAVGDSVPSAAAMRQRMNTLHGEPLQVHNDDRIARAWHTRCAIHALVQSRPQIRMPAILLAFRSLPPSTVRKHVSLLVKQGNLRMLNSHGDRSDTCYQAASDALYHPDAVREKLRTAGRSVGALPTVLPGEQHGGLCQSNNGRYVNKPEIRRPIRNQQAQGSGGAWQGGSSILAAIF